jgi:hypothetical protein
VIKELDIVVLTHDIEEYGLMKGDIGTVVHCYSDSNAYEVEFITAEGKTIAVLTLAPNDVRLIRDREILHVREMAHQAV